MKPDIQECARLHEAIAKRPTPSSRLATDLRDAAIAFARRRAANGATQMTIAHDLGVTTMTVSRWLTTRTRAHVSRTASAKRARGQLIPVQVSESPLAAAHVGGVIVTPRGLRIEGLTLDALCMLVARCG